MSGQLDLFAFDPQISPEVSKLAGPGIDQFLEGLNEQQRDAVMTPADQALQVLAGAGTGKTELISRRFVKLVKDFGLAGIPRPQERILVVTFTSEPVANTLVLCPDADAVKAPLDSRCFSLFITTTDRASDTVSPEDPLPVHQHRAIGTYTVEIDSSAAGKQAALEVLNSVQLSR